MRREGRKREKGREGIEGKGRKGKRMGIAHPLMIRYVTNVQYKNLLVLVFV